MLWHCFLASMLLDKETVVIQISVPLYVMCSLCFHDCFSLPSVYRGLIMRCLSVVLFRFILFGFTQLLDPINYVFWHIFSGNWKVFSLHFFEYSFSPTFLFLPFWDFNEHNIGLFVIVPQVPETLFTFLCVNLFSTLLSKLSKFYLSLLKFTDPILYNLHPSDKTVKDFIILVIIFLVL